MPRPQTPRPAPTGSAVAGMTMVTAGAMTASLASYLLHLPASRWLGPAGYGEFASLLAAQLVLAVPALALQTVVARETVHGSGIDELRSISSEGVSQVMVSFLLDKDPDVAAQEVRDKVNGVLPLLPKTIEQPRVDRFDPDAAPVLSLALTASNRRPIPLSPPASLKERGASTQGRTARPQSCSAQP